MTGFTIILKKRKHYGKYKNEKRKKYIYFLPVIIIAAFSVFAAGLSGEEKEEKIEQETEDIQVFKEINDFSAYYNPIVMNGFFSYEKGDEIDNEKLLNMAVWSILSEDEKEKYELFDGELSIPEKEVKNRIVQLFSDDIKYVNTSAENIFYDEKNKCYTLPVTGFFSEYSGALKSITAEKNRTRLLIECYRSGDFKQDSSGKTVFPEAEKSVVIVLKENKNSYFIESIYEV